MEKNASNRIYDNYCQYSTSRESFPFASFTATATYSLFFYQFNVVLYVSTCCWHFCNFLRVAPGFCFLPLFSSSSSSSSFFNYIYVRVNRIPGHSQHKLITEQLAGQLKWDAIVQVHCCGVSEHSQRDQTRHRIPNKFN